MSSSSGLSQLTERLRVSVMMPVARQVATSRSMRSAKPRAQIRRKVSSEALDMRGKEKERSQNSSGDS